MRKIFAGTSIVGHILRKNISFICTAVDLNALLTALFVIFYNSHGIYSF